MNVKPALHVRTMTPADLTFADSLRAATGWNQTRDDWRRFIAHAPGGCFVAEWNGVPAGTATATLYGPNLAWIGMVLVHPDFRRRGIGRALLKNCVGHLQGRGVRCIKLDATPLGKELYDGLGFRDEWTLTRWVGTSSGPGVPPASGVSGSRTRRGQDGRDGSRAGCAMTGENPPSPALRPWRDADAEFVDPLDAAAFGVSRRRLLETLAPQSRCALVLESAAQGPAGYGLLRPGSQADYLGPVAAETPGDGLRLLEDLAARSDGRRFIVDTPDLNGPAAAWAREEGLAAERHLTRMFLGENPSPARPDRQFAIAGPEVG